MYSKASFIRSVLGLTMCCIRRLCLSMNWSILPPMPELKESVSLGVEDLEVVEAVAGVVEAVVVLNCC